MYYSTAQESHLGSRSLQGCCVLFFFFKGGGGGEGCVCVFAHVCVMKGLCTLSNRNKSNTSKIQIWRMYSIGSIVVRDSSSDRMGQIQCNA